MKIRIILFALMALCAGVARAGVTVSMENDCFFNTDQDFSHGTQVMYTEADWGVGLFQSMYTPHDTRQTALQPYDHPYAGWLALVLEKDYYHKSSADMIQILPGTIGSASGAEQSQRMIHESRGLHVPEGWNNQIERPVALNALYRHTWEPNIASWFDIQPYTGAAFGNVQDYAFVGTMAYLGLNVPKTTTLPGINLKALKPKPVNYRCYLYSGVEGRGVAYNVLVDDNRFNLDGETWVGDLYTGIGITVYKFTVRAGIQFRTAEYQGEDGDLHRLAMIEIGWL